MEVDFFFFCLLIEAEKGEDNFFEANAEDFLLRVDTKENFKEQKAG